MESENFIQETSNRDEREIENNQSSVQQKPVEESQTVLMQSHNPLETESAEPEKVVETTHQQAIVEDEVEKPVETTQQVEPIEEQRPVEKKPTQIKCISTYQDDTITYRLGCKCLKLTLRKNSLRFTLVEEKEKAEGSQNQAQSLEQLLNPPKSDNADATEVFALTHKELTALTLGIFRNCKTFFAFLIENLANQNMLFMKNGLIKFKLRPQDENSPELKLNSKNIINKKQENQKVQVNLQGIEDKLLQFELKEIELIEKIQRKWMKKQLNNSEVCEQPEGEQHMDDSDILYESEDDLLDEEVDEWIDIDKIKKEIENLESEFQEFGKKFKMPTIAQNPLKSSERAHSVVSMTSTSSKPELNLFPPGYLPPHLSKPQSHNIPGTENINSAEQLRFQANQTKKAKLKMAKEMLKLGYSTAEVIQRIEAQQRAGKDDPSAFTPPSARKSFLPSSAASSSSYQPSAPSVVNYQTEKPPNQSQNDRVVRDMFKKLLKEKRYKKLDEIQKHMEREGIHTSVAELKKILNEIRSNNAQRQKAEKQSQAE